MQRDPKILPIGCGRFLLAHIRGPQQREFKILSAPDPTTSLIQTPDRPPMDSIASPPPDPYLPLLLSSPSAVCGTAPLFPFHPRTATPTTTTSPPPLPPGRSRRWTTSRVRRPRSPAGPGHPSRNLLPQSPRSSTLWSTFTNRKLYMFEMKYNMYADRNHT